MYMPILKWRQGEYLALDQLENRVKDKVLPLIEIPPIEWDFENKTHAKSIDEHLEPFSRRLEKKWKSRTACIDLNYIDSTIHMKNGIHPMIYVFDNARKVNKYVIPVTGLVRNDSYQKATKMILGIDKNGVCIRLEFSDLVRPGLQMNFVSLLNFFEIKLIDVDLVLDLKAPNFEPMDGFVDAVQNALKELPQIEQVRSFTIASTNFPDSMGNLSQGVNFVDRLEWEFYLEYCSRLKANERSPEFGDYCVAHPKLLRLDMRTISPSASLRYTLDDEWWLYKGKSVKRNGFGQYKSICQNLVGSSYYLGEQFSVGDKYIKECSVGTMSTGNLTVWRRVATNHHITKVVNDCASLPAF